ncbi:hypothetical protein NC652_004716 [Populus alba x Populus x berolinensis]|uniref:Uncharacterized protein n=1 Tax=Populus alba x Populus x berolinensis TaxID=444605 RepID=A0AAD6RUN0_9ROSI|nr:hypothetical protein NC652_004716 [Populus alba x Populus x berolinensis]KAJ7015469.1 hypothetical protein NC653_004690 [Populus alba x Populus x berolinensis]
MCMPKEGVVEEMASGWTGLGSNSRCTMVSNLCQINPAQTLDSLFFYTACYERETGRAVLRSCSKGGASLFFCISRTCSKRLRTARFTITVSLNGSKESNPMERGRAHLLGCYIFSQIRFL